jgi:hypothetical protein
MDVRWSDLGGELLKSTDICSLATQEIECTLEFGSKVVCGAYDAPTVGVALPVA